MPECQDPTGAFLGTPVLLGSLLYLTYVSHPSVVLNHTVRCEPRPVSHASLAVGLSAKCMGRGMKTYDLSARSM